MRPRHGGAPPTLCASSIYGRAEGRWWSTQTSSRLSGGSNCRIYSSVCLERHYTQAKSSPPCGYNMTITESVSRQKLAKIREGERKTDGSDRSHEVVNMGSHARCPSRSLFVKQRFAASSQVLCCQRDGNCGNTLKVNVVRAAAVSAARGDPSTTDSSAINALSFKEICSESPWATRYKPVKAEKE